MNTKLINYMVAAKLARIIVEPVLVDDDVLLPDGTFINAGTNMDDLEPHVLDALEDYYNNSELTEDGEDK